MLDLLAVYPHYSNETFYHLRFGWHLGAGYVLAYLKQKGISASSYIQHTPLSLRDTVQQILKSSPRIVGFTCYDVNYYFVKLISSELKKNNKNIIIAIGGPSATFSDQLILSDEPSIDICVRGEGEQTAFELIKSLKNRTDLKSIKGITYRVHNSIVRTADRPLLIESDKIGGLDMYPSPYLNGVFPPGFNRYILTSRGCVHRCLYCNFAAMSRWTVRYHSAKRVIDEIKHIAENNPHGTVAFQDDNFSLNKKRAKEICSHIIKEKIPLQFTCLSRADHLDQELLELLKKANFKKVTVGLESSVPKNLRTINKVADDRQYGKDLSPEKGYIKKVKMLSEMMRTLGLNLDLSIITGLPNQSRKEAEETVDFVDNLRPSKCFHDFLTLYPGTPLFQLRKRFNLDIISPRTVLPFKTKFSFNVHTVKLSRYAFVNYALVDTLIEMSKKMLTRMLCYQQKDLNILEAFFKNDFPGLSDLTTQTRLKDRLALSPVFISMCRNDKNIKKEFYSLVERKIPLINLLVLKKIRNKDLQSTGNFLDVYKLVFLTEVVERRRFPSLKIALFVFIPLSKATPEVILKIKRYKNEEYQRKVIVLLLNSKEDKARFKSLVYDNTPLRGIMEANPVDFDMLNTCQWMNRLCPAMAENSIYVDGKAGISFCSKNILFKMPHKKFISKKPFSKRQKQTLLKEIEKRRGCQSCAVEKYCSKCLCTYPYTDKEFCELRKADTTRFVKLLAKHNALNVLVQQKSFLNYELLKNKTILFS